MANSNLSALALAAVFAGTCGCNGDALTKDLGNAVKSVQDSVSTATGANQGSIELSLDPPLLVESCFARFTPPDYGRPGALELTSYKSADEESLPSVYLRIETEARLAEDLIGQSVPATLFVEQGTSGQLWHSDVAEPIQVTIESVNSSLVECVIADVTLWRAGSDQSLTVSGRFAGVRH